MLERIAATIRRHRMLEPGQTVAVAVSGGADSVALLHVLQELAPAWNLSLRVVHLNHQLRGAESDADAAFVGDLAARLGLPCTIRQADVSRSPGNLEQAARNARLALFREIINSGAAARVATGHTGSDQAETVLFRFLRGAGTAGLSGILPVTADGLIRPLIEIDRPEIEQFLRAQGIPWREDSSNASLDFARNRIRHQLLPQLERDWNPAIRSALGHAADWAQAEEAYWNEELDRLWANGEEGLGFVSLKASALAALPLAAARRLVRRAIQRAKGNLRGVGFRHIDAVVALALAPSGRGAVQVPGLHIVRSFDWLRFGNSPPAQPYNLRPAVPGVARISAAGLEISLELIEKTETSPLRDSVYNTRMGCLDWQRLSGSLLLRNWQPGDRYQPRGSTGEQKIKTLFQKARVPAWERNHWPVLLDGSSIVWVRRFGVAAQVAADSASTVILRIREETR